MKGFRLTDGRIIPEEKFNEAIELISSIREYVEYSDEELFADGDLIEAIRRFREKYGCTIVEARQAICHLRGRDDLFR